MTVERAQEVIDKMAEERRRLIAWVRSVPEDDWPKMAQGGTWQAKDYVAHLASIDPLLTGLMRAFQRDERGERPGGSGDGRRFDIDEWNEAQILERRSRSIESLIADMEKHRVDLDAAIGDFTDEQLDRTFHFGGDSKRSPRDLEVGQFLKGLVYHDRWHMEDARRTIAGEAEQPFGDDAWSSMLQERA